MAVNSALQLTLKKKKVYIIQAKGKHNDKNSVRETSIQYSFAISY